MAGQPAEFCQFTAPVRQAIQLECRKPPRHGPTLEDHRGTLEFDDVYLIDRRSGGRKLMGRGIEQFGLTGMLSTRLGRYPNRSANSW